MEQRMGDSAVLQRSSDVTSRLLGVALSKLGARDVFWHAVQCRVHCERIAAEHLKQQGFEVYLPVVTRTIRHARQFRTVQSSLFAGYLFVAVTPENMAWRSINGTRGVLGLVMSAGQPARLPHGLVEELRVRFSESGNGYSSIRVGDSVKLIVGPFSEMVGRLQHWDAKGRVRVLLEVMGAMLAVKTDMRKLVPA
jgi:transcription antitermination factor NusG